MNPTFYEHLTEQEKQEILDNYNVIQTILNLRNQYVESCRSILNADGFSLVEDQILFQDLVSYFTAEEDIFQNYLADYSNLVS